MNRDAENTLVRKAAGRAWSLRHYTVVENFTPLTLSRAFELNWPDYELLFCVADEFNPVIEEVSRVSAAFPAVSAQILIGDDRISTNPKLNNCVKGWRAARPERVTLADSGVLMPKSYISAMMSAWRQNIEVVCSPPLWLAAEGFLGACGMRLSQRFAESADNVCNGSDRHGFRAGQVDVVEQAVSGSAWGIRARHGNRRRRRLDGTDQKRRPQASDISSFEQLLGQRHANRDLVALGPAGRGYVA